MSNIKINSIENNDIIFPKIHKIFFKLFINSPHNINDQIAQLESKIDTLSLNYSKEKIEIFINQIKLISFIIINDKEKIYHTFNLLNDFNFVCCGYTPLIAAIETQNVELIIKLLEKGACVNYNNGYSWSPLAQAIKTNNPEILNLLINNHIEINEIVVKNWYDIITDEILGTHELSTTPLMMAIESRNFELVNWLLNNGADINLATDVNPLIQSIKIRNLDLFNLLIKNSDLKNLGKIALYKAVENNNFQMVKSIIEHEVSVADSKLLFHAIKNVNYNIISLLIEKCNNDIFDDVQIPFVNDIYNSELEQIIDLLIKNNKTLFALCLASANGMIKFVKSIIDSGFEINSYFSDMTPLMYAAMNNQLEIVKLLLDNGADANIKTQDSEFTAIVFAAINGYIDIVKIINQHGCNFNYTICEDEYYGCEPTIVYPDVFDILIVNKQHEIIKYYIDNGVGVDLKHLTTAISHRCNCVFKYLLDYISNYDDNNYVLYETAINYRNITAINLLLNKGIDVNSTNKEGHSLLHFIISKKDYDNHFYDFEPESYDNIFDAEYQLDIAIAELLINAGVQLTETEKQQFDNTNTINFLNELTKKRFQYICDFYTKKNTTNCFDCK